jgi:hypothetical protein
MYSRIAYVTNVAYKVPVIFLFVHLIYLLLTYYFYFYVFFQILDMCSTRISYVPLLATWW